MSDGMTTRKAEGTWVIRAGGAVIGESDRALELLEPGHDPVIYFPRDDIAMALLEPSGTRTTCPLKGEARHYGVQTAGGPIEDAAWSYEDPKAGVAEIAGHLAFHPGKATVERL